MPAAPFSPEELENVTKGKWTVRLFNLHSIASIKTDTRENCKDSLFVALKGENFDGHDFIEKAAEAGALAVCVEKGYIEHINVPEDISVLAVNNTVSAYQVIAQRYREKLAEIKLAAITGSSGKTSTKEILSSILGERYGKNKVYATVANTNNHIGVPQNILRLNERIQAAVIEMGTNHPGEIEPLCRIAKPDIAVITLVGKSHWENFGSQDAITREKCAVFSHLNEGGTVVVPYRLAADKVFKSEVKKKKAKVLTFGFADEADVEALYLGGDLEGSSFQLKSRLFGKTKEISWKLSGKHQVLNAAAAACAAWAADAQKEHIEKGLKKCVLPGMRMRILEKKGVIWINDAYNANPESMTSALAWISEFADSSKLILVLGDMLELGKVSPEAHLKVLRYALEQFPDARIISVGKAMTKASEELKPEQAEKILTFENSTEAADVVQKITRRGMTVFLKGSRGVRLELVEPD